MSNAFLDYLRENNDVFVSIFCDQEEPRLCNTGIVEFISDEEILLKHYTKNGVYDGYAVIKASEVYRIDIDGIYEKKIQELSTFHKKKHSKNLFGNKKISKEHFLFGVLLKISKQKKWIVNFSIDETEEQDSIVGMVSNIKNDLVEIQKLNQDGAADGKSIVSIYDIRKMYCDSEDERLLGKLNQNIA